MADQTKKLATEIMANVSAELVEALFFAEDAVIIQPEPVYRLDAKGNRFYYTFDKEGKPIFYNSATSILKKVMPSNPMLIKWIADKGLAEAERYRDERAHYGTFMHMAINNLVLDGKYDLDQLSVFLGLYLTEHKLSPALEVMWREDLKRDLVSYAKFMIDRNIKPVAVECILCDKIEIGKNESGDPIYLDVGGAMDLVCEMDLGDAYKSGINKGKIKDPDPRRGLVLIDNKSGRNGFYPEHEAQLEIYRTLWNQRFPNRKVEAIFNWSPKGWRTTPDYLLTDQTFAANAVLLPEFLRVYHKLHGAKDNKLNIVKGLLDPKKGLGRNVYSLPLAEVVIEATKRLLEKDQPEALSEDILDLEKED